VIIIQEMAGSRFLCRHNDWRPVFLVSDERVVKRSLIVPEAGKNRLVFPSEINKRLVLMGNIFADVGASIYLVGGAVRDIYLGAESADLDFVTSADISTIKRVMRKTSRSMYDVSRAKGHGTQGVIFEDGMEVEITPFRSAGSVENDVPATKGKPTLAEDLVSRDFTVNAVAADLSPDGFGVLFDPCAGLEDLRKGFLRTPRDPVETMKDDPLRVLRAVRFSIGCGLRPDEKLLSAIKYVVEETDLLSRIAPERVKMEIEKLLMLPHPAGGVREMFKWGLVAHWMPELVALMKLEPESDAEHKNMLEHTMEVLDRAAHFGPKTPRFRMAALLHDVGKPAVRTLTDSGYSFINHDRVGGVLAAEICRRLRFSNEDVDYIAFLVSKHHRLSAYDDDWTDSAVRRAVNDLGERFEDVAALTKSDITTGDKELKAAREARADRFKMRAGELDAARYFDPKPPIDGAEIMKLLGIGPGPRVGEIINMLKERIIDGELEPNDAEGAIELVRRFAKGDKIS